jgi:hypothetical protein
MHACIQASKHERIREQCLTDDEVLRQVDFHAVVGGLLHDALHKLRTSLIKQGGADAGAVHDFVEGECHAAANDHLVHLVQQVVDQQDLVGHLNAPTVRSALWFKSANPCVHKGAGVRVEHVRGAV